MGNGKDLGDFEANLIQMEEDLFKTALLGTDRMTPSVSTLEKLSSMGIETDDATEAVLSGIGMLSLARKGGYPLFAFEGEMLTVCPPETKDYMSARAAKYIQDVLDKKVPIYAYLQTPFFNIVADCAAINNKIVPTGLLPLLLERAGYLNVKPIIGERGLWLAQQKTEWQQWIGRTYTMPKMSVSEAASVKMLGEMPLKPTPQLYNKAFDLLKKIGIMDETAARVALFWVTVVEEMEK
jgi:hypothetical protein